MKTESDLPEVVRLMLDKLNRSIKPNARKKLEVACHIAATDIENVCWCLEDLAQRLREGGMDYVGNGGGYHSSMTWASKKYS